jgi:hypothetical protein
MYYSLSNNSTTGVILFKSDGTSCYIVREWIDGNGIYPSTIHREYISHESKASAIMQLFRVHPQARYVGRIDSRGEHSWKI